MALKEKALRRLGEKLTAANIPFAAGGEWLRCQLGQSAVYHTSDIVVSSADAARADKVLTKLGMRQEQPAPDGVFRCHYHFDGADVTLLAADVTLLAADVTLETSGSAIVLGTSIPLLTESAWDAVAQLLQ